MLVLSQGTSLALSATSAARSRLSLGFIGAAMTMEELLAQVKDSSTDLIRIIEAAERPEWPCVVVSSHAVEAWERRAPGAWPTVRSWLDSRGKRVVIV